jgi:hypothetical protein
MPEDKRVFVYNGPVHDKQASAKPEAPISPANGLQIIKTGFLVGRNHISAHFRRRGRERKFDSMDAHTVIRAGQLRGQPTYCPEFGNWKYRIVADIENEELEIKQLEIVVALDPGEDYEKSPLIILVTGYWR